MKTTTLVLPLALLGSACLSLPDAEVASIRYFDVLAPAATAEPDPSSPAFGRGFRIRRSEASEPIGDRILWREGEHELVFVEELRWAESPLDYVERALVRELVDGRGLVRVEASTSPTLDLFLRIFEEGFLAERGFRIVLDLRLLGSDGRPLLDRSVEATASIEGRDASATARAASQALAEIAKLAADALEVALAGN